MQTSRERDPQEKARSAQPNPLSPPTIVLQAQGWDDILSVTSSWPPLFPPGQVRLCISSSIGGLEARATFPASFGEPPPRIWRKEASLEPNPELPAPAPSPPRPGPGHRGE